MPYVKETVIAGKTIEVHKYFSSRYGKRTNPNRRPHMNPTPEDVAQVNRQNSIKNLARELNANFVDGDFHIILTYRKDERPQTKDEAKGKLSKFYRKAKKAYKAEDSEFKYVCVTEYESTAIHHHLVIQKIDTDKLRECWENGKIQITPLNTDGNYIKLAEYLIKETDKTAKKKGSLYKKRWNSSQNLKKPIIKKELIGAKSWRSEPKIKKGYYLWKDDKDINGFDVYTLTPRQDYIMVRLE